MDAHITHYESSGKGQLSHHGMETYFVQRNNAWMTELGLRDARKRLKLTQPKIAERLGVSVPQVSRWEAGEDNVPSSRLRSFAEAYEASLDELFGGRPVKPLNAGTSWHPKEDTIRSALEAGLLSLTEPRATEADLPILAHGVTAVLQFVADDPSREDSPGFPETVVGIVHTAIRNYKPPRARAS
ncbi:helix-turn-helix domain-containing protein [Sphingopyxis sp. NJF-3]